MSKPSVLTDAQWEQVRLKFFDGEKLADLADEFNIVRGTLYAKSAREKWLEQKTEYQDKLKQTAVAVHMATRAEQLIDFDSNILKMTRVILNRCAVLIRAKADGVSAYDLSSVMGTIRNAQQVGRLALGGTTSNNGVSNPAGGPVQFTEVKDLDELTDEQLLKIINGQQ